MNPFKKGDKVICIKKEFMQVSLEIGKIYTVMHCYNSKNDYFVQLEEIQKIIGHHSYFSDKFQLANLHLIREKLGIK